MKSEVIFRWAARVWGVASTLMLLAFVFGGGEHLRFKVAEAIAFVFFPVGVIAGFVVSWRSDLCGGLVTVGSLALFYLYMFVFRGNWPAGPYFLLFAGPGFLHVIVALIAALRGRDSSIA